MVSSRALICGGCALFASTAFSASVDILTQDDACNAEGGPACTAELLQLSTDKKPKKEPVDTTNWVPTKQMVSAVYTYGAPATHKKPFRNMASTDGCFPGLRSYTEDIKGAFDEIHQVDAAAMNNFYPHAWTNTVCLHLGSDSFYVPCVPGSKGMSNWPQRGNSVFEEWEIHKEPYYTDRLNNITIAGHAMEDEEPFKSGRHFVRMAFQAYDRPVNYIKSLTKLPDNGWKLIGWEEDVNGDDKDPMMLVQDTKSLDCAIVFTGTNSDSEIFTSLASHEADYCGFEGAHNGYRDELWTLSKNLIGPKFGPKLEKCNNVIAVGHSLGGAVAELFAACANSGRTDNEDFKLFAWKKGTPEMQAEVEICEADGWAKHLSPKCNPTASK